MKENVWVFNGKNSNFPSGVFTTKKIAETWIEKHKLSGTLTLYPVDKGIYHWAIEKQFFTPTKDYQKTPQFIQTFSSASQEHYHYLDGLSEA